MLEAIYNGEYQGIDIAPPDSPEFQKKLAKFHAIFDELKGKLNDEELDLLDDLLSCKNLLQADESSEYYMQGFTAGAMLMVDVFFQYRRMMK